MMVYVERSSENGSVSSWKVHESTPGIIPSAAAVSCVAAGGSCATVTVGKARRKDAALAISRYPMAVCPSMSIGTAALSSFRHQAVVATPCVSYGLTEISTPPFSICASSSSQTPGGLLRISVTFFAFTLAPAMSKKSLYSPGGRRCPRRR